ncbi:hypothetical protein AFERRI_400144 [Acidithiobacillus ferrivorans]|jgi:hypothetical protein|uniref:Uncharacterized protein n=1 Tax=Acidithiobacillus ferrivorans TaxID=160808 RepID=A0A060UUA8_9PROT|nr:hypothetical protein AFERRI_400144 [Acidithiobacillus ferrivorans]
MDFPVVSNHDIRMHPFAHFSPLPPEEKHPAGADEGNRDDRKNSEEEQANQQDHAYHHREQSHPPRTSTTEGLKVAHSASFEITSCLFDTIAHVAALRKST